jgi:hypothetical protein
MVRSLRRRKEVGGNDQPTVAEMCRTVTEVTAISEIPCRVNSCPASERSDASIPLITAKPSPPASTKDEATGGG